MIWRTRHAISDWKGTGWRAAARAFGTGSTGGMIALAVAPLRRMARANSPRATGTPSSPPMHVAPADSPATVTGPRLSRKRGCCRALGQGRDHCQEAPRVGDVAAEVISKRLVRARRAADAGSGP